MKENIEEVIKNSIEDKYRKMKEKDILSALTYAECLFILTPENRYCDEIKRLSLLKICEIVRELQKENEELKENNEILQECYWNECVPKQKVKDKIERIDYDIKKTKEIISNNADDWTSNRKNDYQIVRLRAMNTKSLEIKNRLQDLLEEKGE